MAELLNNILIIGSIILLASVLLSKSSNKFGFPILILFLAIGMFAGGEGPGGLEYNDYEFTHSISLIAICLIIFSGGLMTKIDDIKPILFSGISLSTFGVLHTTTFVGGFCYFFLELPFYECLLIGAILSSTDAAAVFTAFNDKSSQVTKKIKSLLELESGSNDPMTYLLVSLFLGFYQAHDYTAWGTAKLLILNPTIGFLGGILFFKLFKFVNDKVKLDFQGLYPALTIGFLFLTYSVVTHFQGNGFLAVYLLAIQLGNAKIVHKKSLIDFFDGVAWLSQIGLFILLGILVTPTRLIEVAPQASIVALFLIFIGRPLSILLSTFNSKLSLGEKAFISWGGLKGATPIVFASLVATEMGQEKNLIFDIVFFTVLFSAILQGTTLKLLAKKLNLIYEAIYDPEFPIDSEVLDKTKNGIKEITIKETDFAIGKRLVDLHLPNGSLVLFLKRQSAFIIPNGGTEIQLGDKVLVVTPLKDDIEGVIKHFYEDHTKKEILESLSDEPSDIAA